MKRRHSVDGLRRAAPAGDLETERLQLARRVEAQHAEAEQADAHLARRRLRLVLLPDPVALLAVVAAELAMMQQNLQRHPFAHPLRQIGIDDAHDGRVGQASVGEHVIDPGAEREDRLEVRQTFEGPLGMAPGQRVGNIRAVAERLQSVDASPRQKRAEALDPRRRLPAGHRQQQVHATIRSMTAGPRRGGASPMR